MNNTEEYTICEKIAEKFEEKWKDVYIDTDNVIIYQGKRIWIWVKVVWAKVWDVPDDSDYVYTIHLRDLVNNHDFYDIIKEIQSEWKFNIEIWEYAELEDCINMLWWKYESINNTIKLFEQSWLKDKDKIKEILSPIEKYLNEHTSYYFISCSDDGTFWLRTTDDETKNAMINKDEIFLKYMDIIKEYFDKNLPEIEAKVEKAREEEIKEEEESRRQQNQKAEDLQNQL